jgi:hypothetical protein
VLRSGEVSEDLAADAAKLNLASTYESRLV